MKKLLLIVFACALALSFGAAYGQVSTTRVTPYDWQCQRQDGTAISNHGRFDTAFVACLNHAEGYKVKGGEYRINKPAPAATGSIILNWPNPTLRTNGNPLAASDIVGHVIRYGTSPTALTQSVTVGPVNTVTLQSLTSGTWYMTIETIALSEEVPRVNETSPPSNVASKTIA